MKTKEYSVEIGGKELTAQFTDIAKQASGSVILRYGNTAVLATATMSSRKREGIDYFPLSVEYEERFYAAGQILGSRFIRREGRPSDEAVTSGRAVDRTIRPLFPKHIRNDVQVVITVLSIDEDDPDVLAINAASLALAVSPIPWNGPVGAVRIGKQNGEGGLVTNPRYEFREHDELSLDLLACGKNGNINMIEVGAKEVVEDEMGEALDLAADEIQKLQAFQEKIVGEIGNEKVVIEKPEISDAVKDLFEKEIAPKLTETIFDEPGNKEGIAAITDEWSTLLAEELPDENHGLALRYLDNAIDTLLHTEALENNRRVDGRDFDEVRGLYAQAGGISSILHGSGIFYRGDTHIFSALTLGGPGDVQVIDGMEVQMQKRFFHHYNFPPFSVGETGRVGGFNRRAIGHGALAEKALRPVIPPVEQFPYTIRAVSEVLSSNGSSSMGSVCGSTLALMDAGVPIKAPVAGIAMGLILDEGGSDYRILTDIQGPEDHHGDMDFKVAGTRDGITAVQMDIKVGGIPIPILKEAFTKAKAARLAILDVIEEEIKEPRKEISSNAPQIVIMKIKKEHIGLVIGSGGKTINALKEMTGAEIDIEEDGTVYITGKGSGPEEAQKRIEEITKEYTPGERLEGEVTRILDFGAFVKIGHETEGLVHISELAPFRVNKVEDVVKVGDTVPVVVKEIDDQGRINLSLKVADPDYAKNKGVTPAPQPKKHHGRRDNKKHTRRG